jgi:YD repeat-containing protein
MSVNLCPGDHVGNRPLSQGGDDCHGVNSISFSAAGLPFSLRSVPTGSIQVDAEFGKSVYFGLSRSILAPQAGRGGVTIISGDGTQTFYKRVLHQNGEEWLSAFPDDSVSIVSRRFSTPKGCKFPRRNGDCVGVRTIGIGETALDTKTNFVEDHPNGIQIQYTAQPINGAYRIQRITAGGVITDLFSYSSSGLSKITKFVGGTPATEWIVGNMINSPLVARIDRYRLVDTNRTREDQAYFFYDNLNRLTGVTLADPQYAHAFAYPPTTNSVWPAAYRSPAGRLTRYRYHQNGLLGQIIPPDYPGTQIFYRSTPATGELPCSNMYVGAQMALVGCVIKVTPNGTTWQDIARSTAAGASAVPFVLGIGRDSTTAPNVDGKSDALARYTRYNWNAQRRVASVQEYSGRQNTRSSVTNYSYAYRPTTYPSDSGYAVAGIPFLNTHDNGRTTAIATRERLRDVIAIEVTAPAMTFGDIGSGPASRRPFTKTIFMDVVGAITNRSSVSASPVAYESSLASVPVRIEQGYYNGNRRYVLSYTDYQYDSILNEIKQSKYLRGSLVSATSTVRSTGGSSGGLGLTGGAAIPAGLPLRQTTDFYGGNINLRTSRRDVTFNESGSPTQVLEDVWGGSSQPANPVRAKSTTITYNADRRMDMLRRQSVGSPDIQQEIVYSTQGAPTSMNEYIGPRASVNPSSFWEWRYDVMGTPMSSTIRVAGTSSGSATYYVNNLLSQTAMNHSALPNAMSQSEMRQSGVNTQIGAGVILARYQTPPINSVRIDGSSSSDSCPVPEQPSVPPTPSTTLATTTTTRSTLTTTTRTPIITTTTTLAPPPTGVRIGFLRYVHFTSGVNPAPTGLMNYISSSGAAKSCSAEGGRFPTDFQIYAGLQPGVLGCHGQGSQDWTANYPGYPCAVTSDGFSPKFKIPLMMTIAGGTAVETTEQLVEQSGSTSLHASRVYCLK